MNFKDHNLPKYYHIRDGLRKKHICYCEGVIVSMGSHTSFSLILMTIFKVVVYIDLDLTYL
jgi:hypothetical protein